MKKKMLSVLSTILTSAFPVLFLYFQNVSEVDFSQILGVLVMFLLLGVGLFIVCSLLWRNLSIGAFAASIFIILLLNYSLIENIINIVFPNARYWHVLPAVIVIAGIVLSFLNKKSHPEIGEMGAIVLCLVFGGLNIFNTIFAMPSIVKKVSYQGNDTAQVEVIAVGTNEIKTDLPNVYYILLDEYASFDVLKKYFAYDNGEFAEFLIDKGFTVSLDSHNTSEFTETIMTNCVNLGYVVTDETPKQKKQDLRRENTLLQLMENYNYSVVTLGHTDMFFDLSGKGAVAQTIGGESIERIMLKNTFLYPLFMESNNEDQQIVQDAFAYFNGYGRPEEPTFTFMYMKTPHQPFLFDADGNSVAIQNWNNWSDPRYYRDQLIFITEQIKSVIDRIISVDKNAVIILQSDHGARGLKDKSGAQIIPFEDRTHILNAIYYSGESFEEINGLSGVNTIRKVFGRLFGLDLEVLRDE